MNLTKSLFCSLVVVVSLACAQSLFAQGTDLGSPGLCRDRGRVRRPRLRGLQILLARDH